MFYIRILFYLATVTSNFPSARYFQNFESWWTAYLSAATRACELKGKIYRFFFNMVSRI